MPKLSRQPQNSSRAFMTRHSGRWAKTNAQIFEIHMMMLEDDDYNESIENIIDSQKVNAEYAVAVTADNFAEMFASAHHPQTGGKSRRCKGYFQQDHRKPHRQVPATVSR